MLDEEKLKYRNDIEYDWDNIKFYALKPDWNSKKIEVFNVFCSGKFQRYCSILYGKDILSDFEAFKVEIQNSLIAAFRGKREYEMLIGDFHFGNEDIEKEHFEKTDVYNILLPNLDIIARMLFENASHIPK